MRRNSVTQSLKLSKTFHNFFCVLVCSNYESSSVVATKIIQLIFNQTYLFLQ